MTAACGGVRSGCAVRRGVRSGGAVQRGVPSGGPGRFAGRRPGWRADDGAGTVLVLAAVGLVVVGIALLGVLAGGLAARQGARTAADLSALAAAQSIAVPPGVRFASDVAVPVAAACDLAADVAARNGAELASCAADGPAGIRLTVRHAGPFGAVTATARAGPR